MITLTLFGILLAMAIVLVIFGSSLNNEALVTFSAILFLYLGFSMFGVTLIAQPIMQETGHHENSTIGVTETSTDNVITYTQFEDRTLGLLFILLAVLCLTEVFEIRSEKRKLRGDED